MDNLWFNLRYTLRQLRKSPGFTLTVTITLALGIGANTAIFTLIDSILLRPLPYAHQDRLMLIPATTAPAYPKGWIRAIDANTHSFSSIAGFGADAESNLSDSSQPERAFGSAVTVNVFDVLGVHPALGSFFTSSDAVAGQDHDVVLSHNFWQQRYGGDPSAVGRKIEIDGIWRQIVGVMPAGVHFPYADTQFVIPVSFRADDPNDAWSSLDLHAIGRLKDGVSPAQAQAELRRLHNILLPLFPWRMPDIWASDMVVTPLLAALTGAIRPRLLLLFGAVGLVLLIACANVASLMLARASAREREIAIRGALGASHRRLIRQFLSEAVVLGVMAGTVALVGVVATLHVLVSLLPPDTPRLSGVSLGPTAALFTCGVSVLVGLLCGIIPAIKMAKPDLLETLRLGTRGLTGKGMKLGLLRGLVVAQIALTVVVITGAGLMLRTLYNLSSVDPGFSTAHTVTAEVSLDRGTCSETGRCYAFFNTLLHRLQGAAGVQGAAVADALPLSGRDDNYVFDAENHPRDPRQGALIATGRTVSPEFFQVLGITAMRGRLLTAEDASGTTHAVVINERMAQRLWPDENPIGKHLLSVVDEPSPAVWDASRASVVVGVVRNARDTSLSGGIGEEVYLPFTPLTPASSMYVLMRISAPSADAAALLRSAVGELDAQAPVSHVRTLNEIVSGAIAAPRALSILLLGFGVLAVVIGSVGVYSLIAYIVSWRTREIGLRLALGASWVQVVFEIVGQSVVLASAGSIVGLALAAAFSRTMRSFLFEVRPFDPITYGIVLLITLLVAIGAASSPAQRAASVDPMQTLRTE